MKHCRLVKYQLHLPDHISVSDDRSVANHTETLHISFFTDLHSCCSESEREEFLRILNRSGPDIVLCGGDSIVAVPGHPVLPAAQLLGEIARKYPLFTGTGNHEYRARLYPETYGHMYAEYRHALENTKCCLLENADIRLTIKGVPIRICGFDMQAEYYSRFRKREVPVQELREIFGEPDPFCFNILLAHHPKMIKPAFSWGADLVLSGHYHGGIMRISEHRGLISPDLRLLPRNAYGHFQSSGKHAIISSGCGEHSIPVRICNPREIVSLLVTR